MTYSCSFSWGPNPDPEWARTHRQAIVDDPWLLTESLRRVLIRITTASDNEAPLTRVGCRSTALNWLRQGGLIRFTPEAPYDREQLVHPTLAGAVVGRKLIAGGAGEDSTSRRLRKLAQDHRLNGAERDAIDLLIRAVEEIADGRRGPAA